MTYQRPMSRPGNQARPPFPPQPAFPPGYLKDGYFDKAGNILDDVIMQWSQALASAFHQSRPQLKTAQLRGFFGEVRRQQARLTNGVAFTSVRPEILKLDSLAESRLKRNNAPALFREFIRINVTLAAKDEKSFQAFVTHFECIVGYYPETK